MKTVNATVAKKQQIRISLKGLVKYMTSRSSVQRKTLSDFKYPNPEGKAQAGYYREARSAIVTYHRNQHIPDWLRRRADILAANASANSGQIRTRLNHNARALRAYERQFSGRQFTVLTDLALELTFAGVRVSVYPDLHVQEGGKEKMIKLDFNVGSPDDEGIKIVTQAMFEAAEGAGLGLPSSCVLYYDLSSGKIFKGARMGSRMLADIEAACLNIAAIWGTI